MGKTSKEKMEKWQKNNREKHEQEKDCVWKRKKKDGITEEELSELRLRDKVNMQRSRVNMSFQKKQAIKVKDCIRKARRRLKATQQILRRKTIQLQG